MSELSKRIISALIAAPVFLYATWLGGWYFTAMVIAISVVIQFEILYMLRKQDIRACKWMAPLLGTSVILMTMIPELAWILFLALLLFTLILDLFRGQSRGCDHIMATILVAIMVPALLSGLILLRNFGDNQTGFIITLTLLLMVWANDVFAFAGGKATGKHPLAPNISPSKTVEGFLWGFLGCFTALGLCMLLITDYPIGLSIAVPFALIAALFGPAGDLMQSKLKRAAGIKDSSRLMPGHGGLYDRFDAVLFSAPAASVYFYTLHYFSIL